MILYHGSDHIIQSPEYGKGKRTNDYGRGFYCTEHLELAKEWACQKETDGFANMYEFDPSELTILNLNSGEYNILNWLALLAENRSYWENSAISEEAKSYLQEFFLLPLDDVDVVIGYRADDSYFTFAKQFVANGISVRQLKEAMKLGELGEQIVLISRKAFDKIKYLDAIPAEGSIYASRAMSRDHEARKRYRKETRKKRVADDIFMMDILRGEVSHDDPRLF